MLHGRPWQHCYTAALVLQHLQCCIVLRCDPCHGVTSCMGSLAAPHVKGIEASKVLSRILLLTTMPSVQTEIHWYGWAAMIFYLCSLGFYLWVRITKTLNLGPGYIWYGIYLLVVEILGATTVVLYGEHSSIARLAAGVLTRFMGV